MTSPGRVPIFDGHNDVLFRLSDAAARMRPGRSSKGRASNVLFALYGLSAHLYPVFLLHSILFPINVFKLTHFELLPRNGRSMVGSRFGSRPPIHKQSR